MMRTITKTLLTLLVFGLVTVGCRESENGAYKHRLNQTNAVKPIKELTKEDIVGSYTLMGSWVFHENGKREFFSRAGTKMGEGKWKLVENEVHTDSNFGQNVYRIEPNGDMTKIAVIHKEGKREELPNGLQMTLEKIKPKPTKELTLEEKKVVGTYELELKKFGETHRYVLLDNSTVEYYLDGKKEEAEHKWSIVDKDVHIERENRAVSVFSINKDNSITGIATIDEDGKRKEIPEERQYTRKKIK